MVWAVSHQGLFSFGEITVVKLSNGHFRDEHPGVKAYSQLIDSRFDLSQACDCVLCMKLGRDN